MTITIGGNDSWNGKRGLYDTLVRCAGSNLEGDNGTTCATGADAPVFQPTPAGKPPVLQLPTTADLPLDTAAAGSFYSAISPTIVEIKRTAPNAMIEIVGYPAIIPSGTSSSCNGGPAWYFENSELAYLRPLLARLKAVQQAAVNVYPTSAKVRYVDTSATGHDFCQTSTAAKWVDNPIFSGGTAGPGSLHPLEAGMANFASLAVAKYQAG